MTGWHEGPMAAFDLETTSADVESARIVTACVVHVDGSGAMPPESETWLIDPGIDIPAETTAIHGITTDHAREHGQAPHIALEAIATAVSLAARSGVPVIAFNAPFDLTVLDRDTRRNGLEPFGDHFPPGAAVIDPYVLDKHLDPYRGGRRTLTDACAHYGVRIDKAHDAAADAIAAARVAWRIAQQYPVIASMPLPELRELQVQATKAGWAVSLQNFRRRQGKTGVIDGSWPMKAWTGEAVRA